MKKLLALMLLAAPAALGQVQHTPNTLTLAAGQVPPKADIHALSWLAGEWIGPAMGGVGQEVWTAPQQGSMMCSYKFMKGGKIVFYEFVMIVAVGGSLELRLKHFTPEFVGWEEKDKCQTFKLVQMGKERVDFAGFAIQKNSDGSLTFYVAMHDSKTGQNSETRFDYFTPGVWARMQAK